MKKNKKNNLNAYLMIKSKLKKIFFVRYLNSKIRIFVQKHRKIKTINKGSGKIKKCIIHNRNGLIEIKEGAILNNPVVRVNGVNNTIIFGENSYIGPQCSFWMEGNDITIIIGSNTTLNQKIHFCAQEDGMSIKVGDDCMLSNNIIIRTSDSHPIYNDCNQRINNPREVVIGNHVWIAPNTKVFKGVKIGDGAIIGSNSLVTKGLPSNVLAVGIPAKIVKEKIHWSREKII